MSGSTAVTVSEAAARLGVCEQSVRNALARGELAGYRVGRAVRVTVASIESLMSGKKPAG